VTDDEPADSPDSPGLDEDHPDDSGSALPPGSVPTAGNRVLSSSVDAVVAAVILTVVDLTMLAAVVHPKAGHKLTAAQNVTALWLQIASLVIAMLVFVVMERTGGSSGKRLMKLRTVGAANEYPAPWLPLTLKYVTMFFLLLLPFGYFLVLLGLFLPFWRPDRRTAFDLITRLRVVPLASLTPSA